MTEPEIPAAPAPADPVNEKAVAAEPKPRGAARLWLASLNIFGRLFKLERNVGALANAMQQVAPAALTAHKGVANLAYCFECGGVLFAPHPKVRVFIVNGEQLPCCMFCGERVKHRYMEIPRNGVAAPRVVVPS